MTNTAETDREKRKADLMASAESYLANIQTQLGDFKEVGKNALAIGGIILGAYLITRLFISEDESISIKEKTEETQEDSIILTGLKGVATAVLLAILKDKLMELIEYITEKDAEIATQ